MLVGRLAWFGFALVILGWALLAADIVLSEVAWRSGAPVAVTALRSDIVTTAQTAIVSGFGLAIFGALRQGFGALNRFFEAVLQRSSAPRPAPVVTDPEPQVQTPASRPMSHPGETVVQAGRGKERNYVILANGSVEVETLLGTRVFATLDEARDFIR